MDINVNTVAWVLICAALVYFMQAGFALCEAGLTRAKNTGNILTASGHPLPVFFFGSELCRLVVN